MAENDIYNSQARYESFKNTLDSLMDKPTEKDRRKKYYCKNKANLKYFKKLFSLFDAKDTSYVRRLRLLLTMRLIVHSTEKDLSECDREEVNKIVASMHQNYKSVKSKSDFINDMKYLWKALLPEKDERDRIDDTIVPYPVRHLSSRIDRSKEVLKNDRLTYDEFEKIVKYFVNEPNIQAYITLMLDSLGRPQETAYTRIRDVEIFENYAKIWISSHGKEGTGFLQCIESYPYITKWHNQHPLRNDKEAFFFVNIKNKTQLKNVNVNKKLRKACKDLGINKDITCYSLKRNGVTYKRLRGDSDVEIQHTARWTSTKQLQTYDKSTPEDALKISLVKRGILTENSDEFKEEFKKHLPTTKECVFCGKLNGFSEEICSTCKRHLDRNKISKIEQDAYAKMDEFFSPDAVQKLFKTMHKLQKDIEELKG